MTSPVYSILINDPATSALVGTRIWRSGRAPENEAKPYITWSTVGGHTENYLSERPSLEEARVQINCWAKSETDCRAVCNAVVAALEIRGAQDGVPMDDYETDTKLFCYRIDFTFWNRR